MTVEEIDLYWLKPQDIMNYLPTDKTPGCGAKDWEEFAQMLVDKKVKAADCDKIDKAMAEAIDGALSVDIRLPESDPMQQKVPEPLFEYNSPDEGSPIIVTSNSVITHQILGLILNAAKVKAFVIPVDAQGLTYDNAVAGNFFTGMQVMKAITGSGISTKTTSHKMIIGGLGKDVRSSIERITKWNVEVGPVSGFELPMYLLANR